MVKEDSIWMTYDELPENHKVTVREYLKDLSDEEFMMRVVNLLFAFEDLPIDEAKRRCEMFVANNFESFEAYHESYVGDGTGIPDHGTSKWACIVYGEDGWIDDGWHRFHSYVKAGDKTIPILTLKELVLDKNTWMTYSEMPMSVRNALIAYWYMEELTMEDLEKKCQEFVFRFEQLPVDIAKQECMKESPELVEMHGDFETYHQSYLSVGDVPNHGGSMWPCILSSDYYEWLDDGWHRFHSYVRKGDRYIPVLTIKRVHQLNAKSKIFMSDYTFKQEVYCCKQPSGKHASGLNWRLQNDKWTSYCSSNLPMTMDLERHFRLYEGKHWREARQYAKDLATCLSLEISIA